MVFDYDPPEELPEQMGESVFRPKYLEVLDKFLDAVEDGWDEMVKEIKPQAFVCEVCNRKNYEIEAYGSPIRDGKLKGWVYCDCGYKFEVTEEDILS